MPTATTDVDAAAMPAEAELFGTPSGKKYRPHWLAKLWPPMPKADFDALKESIRRAGKLQQPIKVTPDDQVLDGRHRLAACCALGIEPDIELCEDEASFVDVVVNANERRRHLSASQRAMVAAELATLERGRPADMDIAQNRAFSQGEAAERFGVSRTLVQAARKVRDRGVDELVRLVARGEVTVSIAAMIADLDRDEQRELVRKGLFALKSRAAGLRTGRSSRRDPAEAGCPDEAGSGDGGPSDAGPRDDHPPASSPSDNAVEAAGDGSGGRRGVDAAVGESSASPVERADLEASEPGCPVTGSEQAVRVEGREVEGPARAGAGDSIPSMTRATDGHGGDGPGGRAPTGRGARRDGKDDGAAGHDSRPIPYRLVDLPLARELEDPSKLEIEAWLSSVLEPAMAEIRLAASRDAAVANILRPGLDIFAFLGPTIAKLLDLPAHERWAPCGLCGGGKEGTQEDCPACEGRGYEYDPAGP